MGLEEAHTPSPTPTQYTQGMWVNREEMRFAVGNPAAVGMLSQALSPGPAGSSVTTFLVALTH